MPFLDSGRFNGRVRYAHDIDPDVNLRLGQLCSNCGFTYSLHYGLDCPGESANRHAAVVLEGNKAEDLGSQDPLEELG
jgi:hypothetical protein